MEMIQKASDLLKQAESLLITAGAGMGVDSGLPDFRGTQGFWKAYPPYEKLGLDFISAANPANFLQDPAFGWGFYGHRYNLYKATVPHDGFRILKEFGDSLPGGCFVYTSNVDGHFEKAGFDPDQVAECHGSINYYQCINDCLGKVRKAEWEDFVIDESNMTAREPLPICPDCGEAARPAILMFGDWNWNDEITAAQERRYEQWLSRQTEKKLAIIELGAGTAISTVRNQSEKIARNFQDAFLIRINPREPEIPYGLDGFELPLGALKALREII